ncbi:MAG: GGDEF domain-containing protein [Lachnospiraceae bacterium]|nr:GGDEF domain-containing protein [Lachnospiraceae bacterium]
MNRNSINFYGYNKQIYKDCLPQIRVMNLNHAAILNTWFLVVSLAALLIRFINPGIFTRFNMLGLTRVSEAPFLIFFLLALLLELLILYVRKKPAFDSRFIVYGNMLLILAFSIFSSAAQAYKASVFFPVFLTLLSVAYIDTFYGMLLFFVACSAVFLLTVFQGIAGLPALAAKTTSIALEDLMLLFFFFILALVLHYTIQRTRIRQFVVYLRSLQLTRELEVKSSFDTLTSLLNRNRFMTMVEEALRRPYNDYPTVCLVDLDNFKQINDKLGHQMGDKAIQLTGQTIIEALHMDLQERWSFPERAILESASFAGRLGGDEFILFLRGCKSREEVEKKLFEILHTLNGISFENLNGLSASLGVTEIFPEEKDIDNIYRRADEALYRSKETGKNRIMFYRKAEE